MGKTLIFAVYDFDRFSKHDEIGEVRFKPATPVDTKSLKIVMRAKFVLSQIWSGFLTSLAASLFFYVVYVSLVFLIFF